jgi:hypothetical protein
MEPFTRNGGMIGIPMSIGDFERYVVGETTGPGDIDYVGGSTFAFSGQTGDRTLSLTALTNGSDTSPSAGDLVVVFYGTGSNTTARTISVKSSYTNLTQLIGNDTYDAHLVVGYKVMGSTPDTSVIVSGTGSTADAGVVVVHVFRGVDQTTPLDVASVSSAGANSVLCNPGPITPTTEGAWVIAGGSGAHVDGTDSYSSSDLTSFLTAGANDTYDVTVGVGIKTDWVSGAFDPAAFTFSGTNAATSSWVAYTLAVRPATVPIPIEGNRKRSGVWDLPSVYGLKYSEYEDSLGIKFVGTPTSTTTTSITLPSGLQQDDIVFIASMADLTTPALPTGYTNGQTGYTNTVGYRWSYKVMGATPDTSASGLSSSSTHIAFAVRSVDTSVIFDQTASSPATNTTGMPNPPAITTQSARAKVIAFGFLDDDLVSAVDPPNDYELIASATYGVPGTGGTVMAAHNSLTKPATTNPSSFGGNGTDSWVATTIALKWNGV